MARRRSFGLRPDEATARRVACPRCSAGYAEPCRTSTGAEKTVPAHRPRVEAGAAWAQSFR